MTLYDHIQQLWAELSASCNAREIQRIKAELKKALAKQKRLNKKFDAWFPDLE